MGIKLQVQYQDNDLLMIDKPSGLLSIPDGYDPDKPYLQALLEPDYGRLWIVHRLDKETSGLILLARNEIAHRHLTQQFSKHEVEKVYRAIVIGVPAWEEIDVDKALRTNVGRRKRTVVDPHKGKPAKTSFHLLRRLNGSALVEARPKTGRTHQIRAHLYSLGHPVLADPLYGEGRDSLFINRLALHAHALTCIHPTSAERLSFEVPEGEDFLNALQALTV